MTKVSSVNNEGMEAHKAKKVVSPKVEKYPTVRVRGIRYYSPCSLKGPYKTREKGTFASVEVGDDEVIAAIIRSPFDGNTIDGVVIGRIGTDRKWKWVKALRREMLLDFHHTGYEAVTLGTDPFGLGIVTITVYDPKAGVSVIGHFYSLTGVEIGV
jgi:hypothetical protein